MNRILVIGGTDNSSGAGLFADFETLSKLGASSLCCSAVTARNEEFVSFSNHSVEAHSTT